MAIITDILETIEYAIKKYLEKAKFNKEYIGTVEKVLGGNKFQIRYNNTSYEMNLNSSLPLKVFDKVHVILPNNTIKDRYILEDLIYGYIT